MHEIKLTYGELEGRLIHVNNVENGIACKCICPGCGLPLVARNQGKIMRSHFAHHQTSDCINGAETALHRMAKQLIAERCTITTPSYNATVYMQDKSGELHEGPDRIYPSQDLVFDHVIVENDKKDYRVDATGFYGDTFLHIEIKVTHAVDSEKQQKVIANNEAMIEVDLSGLSIEILMNEKAFEDAVLSDVENKHWIYHPEARIASIEDKKALQLIVDKTNEEYLHQEQEALKMENARIQEQDEIDKKRKLAKKELDKKRAQEQKSYHANVKKHREPHEPVIQNLREALYYKNQSKRDEKYEKELLTYCSEKNFNPKNLSPYISIQIDSDWIFSTHPFIWKNSIHEDFLHNNKGKTFNAAQVLEHLSEKFTIPDYVTHLSNLKGEYKREGRKRGKSYGNYGCWFFTPSENNIIPSPWHIVQQYLHVLKDIGFLVQTNTNKFDFVVKIENAEEVAKEASLVNEILQKGIENQQRIKSMSTEDIKEKKRVRVELIILSEKAVFAQHQGNGIKCNQCLLVSAAGTDTCPFCGNRSFKDFPVTESHLKNAYHKYKCHSGIRDAVFSCEDIDTTTLNDNSK